MSTQILPNFHEREYLNKIGLLCGKYNLYSNMSKIIGKYLTCYLCMWWFFFTYRWKRVCSEENFHKMGEFTFDQNRLQDSRSVYRPKRWKDVDETTWSFVWRKTSKPVFLSYDPM